MCIRDRAIPVIFCLPFGFICNELLAQLCISEIVLHIIVVIEHHVLIRPRNSIPTQLRSPITVSYTHLLALALNLAFSCSLRMGELLGLTWDCIDISEDSIKNGCAYIFVNKELQRVNRNALEQLGEKGVVFKFPPALALSLIHI